MSEGGLTGVGPVSDGCQTPVTIARAAWRELTGRAAPNTRVIVARAECDYRAPAFFGEELEVRLWVGELGRSMGLRPVDVGVLSNAGPLEGITAVLATINRRYKLKNSGIKITGL